MEASTPYEVRTMQEGSNRDPRSSVFVRTMPGVDRPGVADPTPGVREADNIMSNDQTTSGRITFWSGDALVYMLVCDLVARGSRSVNARAIGEAY